MVGLVDEERGDSVFAVEPTRGTDLYRKLRSRSEWRDIPVIVVSAKDAEALQAAVASGPETEPVLSEEQLATERAGYFRRMRALARGVAKAYVAQRDEMGFPWLSKLGWGVVALTLLGVLFHALLRVVFWIRER